MGYLEIANSPWMWLACIPGVALVLFQATLFMRMAFKRGREMGMERSILTTGFKVGLISAIGPAFAILIGMMALIVNVGAPFAWLRLSYIGSIMYELMGANFGAMAVGTELGAADFGQLAFASAVWCQTLGALGWLIVCAIVTHKLEFVRIKMAGGKMLFLPILTAACMIGAFSYLSSARLIRGGGSTVAVLVGMVCMMLFIKLSRKLHQAWLLHWSLGFSMIIGMFVGAAIFP